MFERVDHARADSDVAYFWELLYAGELIMKLVAAALVACLNEDRERHRYRIEYDLVHADGIGSWAAAIDDCLTGPASQALSDNAKALQRELTQGLRLDSSEWQPAAVVSLQEAFLAIDESASPSLGAKVAGRRWFSDFASLRNRTRGHGATTPASCSAACEPLRRSLDLIVQELSVLRAPWAHLRRNLSGKYRVDDLGNGSQPFDYLRTSKDQRFGDGVFLWISEPRHVALCASDPDVRDFYLPNGGAGRERFEALSYATDTRISVSIEAYLTPPTQLPGSETEGLGALNLVGNAFANLPPAIDDYVSRDTLEADLSEVLLNDRHPVITLVGRGGIGKTSLALQVLHSIAGGERYFAIVWFSARDIELLPEGPKLVRPHVLSPEDIAAEYVSLLGSDSGAAKPVDALAKALGDQGDCPTLFVFDNFETVRSPVELYRWLDTYIRLPNKVLITTRSREFKGDFWVEVGGMTEDEFESLVRTTAVQLNIDVLVDRQYIQELYKESDGHPYIAKVLLGEVARAGRKTNVARILASQERVLEALFERTFTQLAPASQRIFLTLASWRSLVPVVAIESALNRPGSERIDVDAAVDELRRSSLLELAVSSAGDQYVSVPLSASLFGQRKQSTSAWKTAIAADLEILRLFGAVQVSGTDKGFAAQVGRLFHNVAERLQKRPDEFDRHRPVLEFVAREEPIGWTLLAQLLEEYKPKGWTGDSAEAYRRYLEQVPADGQIWRALARACRQDGDYLGSVQALIERARLAEAPFADVSYAANRVNTYLYDGSLTLDTAEKQILIGSLIEIMTDRQTEAGATDLSSLAWLLMHVKKHRDAKDVVAEGLEIDASNPHLRRLAKRLKVRVP